MFDRLRRLLQGARATASQSHEQTRMPGQLAQIDRLVKLNDLTVRELREQRDALNCREEELKTHWKEERSEDRRRDRLVDIRDVRGDKKQLENRLSILYERGRGLREARATLLAVADAKLPSLSSEQIDAIRATAVDAMHELRETQMAFSQLEGTTTFSSNLDASLKELEAELKCAAGESQRPTPVEAPDYADRELEELKRELEGEAGGV